jgi:hypothetical protein
MASTAYVGLVVTSHDSSAACTAVFDNVSVPGWTNLSAPLAPTVLSGLAGDATAALTWTAASGATTYNLKRGIADGGPYTNVQNVATTNFNDSNLTNGLTYYYVVSALNAGGESTNSTQVALTPIPSVNFVMSDTNLTLSWSLGTTGFRLQSRTNLMSGDWQDVTLPAPENVGGQWQVTLPITGDAGAGYYRLTK